MGAHLDFPIAFITYLEEVRGRLTEAGSLLPPCWSWGLNLDNQMRQKVPLSSVLAADSAVISVEEKGSLHFKTMAYPPMLLGQSLVCDATCL